MPAEKQSTFIKLSTEEILKQFNSSLENGLSNAQAKKALKKYGLNTVIRARKKHPLVKFFTYFINPLILVLLFIGTYFLLFSGDQFEAFVVYSMVIISVILDFWQESKADRAAEKLQKKVAMDAEVIRDGVSKRILVTQLVPGDIVFLKAGDVVPADGIILESKDFFLNQSAMTGEAFPVEKSADSPDELRAVFDGTSVQTGFAKIIVTTTGLKTEFAQILARLDQADPPNPFFIGIRRFSSLIIKLVLATTIFIFLVAAFVNQNWLEALTFAIAIAVGLTPEFLPMIMSICMSRGAKQMARKGVIVKKMTALPSFGSMNVLCTDKTGTLTEDKITLIKCTSVFGKPSDDVYLYTQLNSHFQSDIGNAMDHAILEKPSPQLKKYQEIDEIPFSFDRRRSTVIVEKDGEQTLVTKGAPEQIFPLLKYYRDGGETKKITKALRDELALQLHLLSDDGFRVLAVATRKIDPARPPQSFSAADEKDLEIIGFASFLDPLKNGVTKVISELNNLGITVKVITGDNPVVTKNICQQAGIDTSQIMTGDEVDKLNGEALAVVAKKCHVFARFNPLQKERLIQALKADGFSVGYMGDGINDAPSLRLADVGISVNNAVDVAREAADIILTQKSLRVLENGVIDGRKTFVNTMKYVKVGMSSSFGNVISMFIGMLFLPFLPMLPIQIIFNDFLYDLAQMTVAYDNVDDDLVEKPQFWDMKAITKYILLLGPISSIFDLILFAFLVWVFKAPAAVFQTAWFVSSIATQSFVMLLLRSPKPLFKSKPGKILLFTTFTTTAIGILVALTPFGNLFNFTALPVPILLVIALLLLGYCLTVSLAKKKLHQSL